MPLVGKELAEQASRGRTYVLRVVYAAVLYGLLALVYADDLMFSNLEPEQVVGSGREIFVFLVACHFTAVYLLIPAALCSAINSERASGTFDLLVLAGIAPRDLMIQKLLVRMTPLASWLLVSLPGFAIAQGMGGLSLDDLGAALWCVLVAAVQIGALTLWVSVQVENPGRAFFAVYLRAAVWFFGYFLGISLLFGLLVMLATAVLETTELAYLALGLYPPLLYAVAQESSNTLLWVLIASVPALLSAAYFVRRAVAELHAVQRSNVPPPDPDRFLRRIHRDTMGKKSAELAEQIGDRPIAWREKGRLIATFGSTNLSVVWALAFMLLFFNAVGATSGNYLWRGENLLHSASVQILLAIQCIGMVVAVVTAMTDEIAAGTADLLRTLPLPGRQIIYEKLSPARLLAWMLGACVVIVLLLECLQEWHRGRAGAHQAVYVLSWAVLLPSFAGILLWGSTWLGMRIRVRFRAVTACILTLLAWLLLPLVVPIEGAELLSPVGLIHLLEYGLGAGGAGGEGGEPARARWGLLGRSTVYIGIWLALRALCLAKADRLLGRT